MQCGLGPAPDHLKQDPEVLSISPSAIMEFLKSPAHYHAKYIRKIHKQTKAMRQGNQVHMAILEPDKFFSTYCREPNIEHFPNALATVDQWKALCAALDLKVSGKKEELKQRCIEKDAKYKELDWDFIVTHSTQGREVIGESDWTAIDELKASLEYHPKLKSIFARPGFRETFAWIYDDKEKILYKFKTDFVDDMGTIVDIKKTPSAEMRRLSAKIYNENLHVQGAMYFDFWTVLHNNVEELKKTSALGDVGWIDIPKPRAFVIAAFEMASPYIWQPYNLDAGALDAGELQYRKAIMRLKECREKNEWPGYSKKIEPISLPHWAFDQINYDMEREGDDA